MVHIDIKRDPADVKTNDAFPKLLVQTSTDGAGWRTQYVIYAQAADVSAMGAERARQRQETNAADCARTFANGARYAGADVRITMFGYEIS